MEIVNKRQFAIGETCYFLVCSADNPFKYLRCKGTVKYAKSTTQGMTFYRMLLTDIYENRDVINHYVHNHRFRVQRANSGVVFSKRIYTLQFEHTKAEFIKSAQEYYFEAPSTLVYESIQELQEYYKRAVEHLKGRLAKFQDDVS